MVTFVGLTMGDTLQVHNFAMPKPTAEAKRSQADTPDEAESAEAAEQVTAKHHSALHACTASCKSA